MPNWSAEEKLAEVTAKAVALDTRRRKQIDNQIGSINRLLKPGHTYTDEMTKLQELLAERDASLEEFFEEMRGLADSLDRVSLDSTGHRILDGLESLMRRVKEAQGAS